MPRAMSTWRSSMFSWYRGDKESSPWPGQGWAELSWGESRQGRGQIQSCLVRSLNKPGRPAGHHKSFPNCDSTWPPKALELFPCHVGAHGPRTSFAFFPRALGEGPLGCLGCTGIEEAGEPCRCFLHQPCLRSRKLL